MAAIILIYDQLVGEALPVGEIPEAPDDLDAFEALDLDARHAFWMDTMRRCVRCYACRNACPMCVCRAHCVADSRSPHWLSLETNVSQKWFFQVLHSLHLAGRCVDCRNCEKACQSHLPLHLLHKWNEKVIFENFQEHLAGVHEGDRGAFYKYSLRDPDDFTL